MGGGAPVIAARGAAGAKASAGTRLAAVCRAARAIGGDVAAGRGSARPRGRVAVAVCWLARCCWMRRGQQKRHRWHLIVPTRWFAGVRGHMSVPGNPETANRATIAAMLDRLIPGGELGSYSIIASSAPVFVSFIYLNGIRNDFIRYLPGNNGIDGCRAVPPDVPPPPNPLPRKSKRGDTAWFPATNLGTRNFLFRPSS